MRFLNIGVKTDIAVSLVFFSELFDEDLIPGSLRKLFTFSREELPVQYYDSVVLLWLSLLLFED